MSKRHKGTVIVSIDRGMLRLRLPRHLYGGKQKSLYLGLPDTPVNRQAAQFKADAIAADIAFDRFDPTLEKYKPQSFAKPEESMKLIDLWCKYTIFKERSLSFTTIQKDFTRIRNHIAKLPSQELEDARKIRKHLIDSFAIKTAKRVLMHINACCEWAAGEELIVSNPFAELPGLRGGPPKKSINPFTQQEQEQIIEAFENHPIWHYYAPFVKFLFFTGCRTSEAVGLQWKHVNSSLTTITFAEAVVERQRKDTKTHTIRKFPVNQKLRSLLTSIRPQNPSPDTPVFLSQEGATIDAGNFLTRAWKNILAGLPIEYRPQYNTRHTFISSCLEKNIPVAQVARWVGNSSKTIWEHYAGLTSELEVPE